MLTVTMPKFRFRIRTRNGMPLDNLTIGGRDEAEARRRLEQIYRGCEVLEVSQLNVVAASRSATPSQPEPVLPRPGQSGSLAETVVARCAANQPLLDDTPPRAFQSMGGAALAVLPEARRADPVVVPQAGGAPEACAAEEEVSFESLISLITR